MWRTIYEKKTLQTLSHCGVTVELPKMDDILKRTVNSTKLIVAFLFTFILDIARYCSIFQITECIIIAENIFRPIQNYQNFYKCYAERVSGLH